MRKTKSDQAGLTRREFLVSSAVSAASSVALRGGATILADAPWYSRMRRVGQINFNERDPLAMDVEAWMGYWASLKTDAVLLNGGGIVAFYPTQVPYHHRSQFLGTRDLFGEAVAAAVKRGIRAVARMDCNFAYEEALKAHPEWFERNRDGSPRPHPEAPWLYATCTFSAYFTEQMPAIYREINRRYAVSGFFTNGWPSTGSLGVCHCENCRKVYREQMGGEPPEGTDATSALYRRYYEIYMDRIAEVWKLWDSVAKEKQPDAVYVGNLGGGIHTVKSLRRFADFASWFNADHQGRAGDTPIWDCAQQGRVAQAVMKGQTVTNVTGAYSNGRPVWRHVSKSVAETTMWLAQTTASGMVPWFHWLGGSPEDNRWRETGRSFYQWIAANEPHFRNRQPLADLAVVYPQSTIAFYRSGGPGAWRGGERNQTADYLQGLYYALLEGRFLFEFVHQQDLPTAELAKYRALLVPNAAYLSDAECEAVRRYVAAGGSLWATFETSRYNEWGDPREDFALGDLFGASLTGDVIGPAGNSYMRIEGPHAITRHFQGTSLLPGPENRLPIRLLRPGRPELTVVPAYPAFPPEMVYPRIPRTEEPAVVLSETGRSRMAYFPGDIDRTFWRSGNTDLGRLIRDSIEWARGEGARFVEVEGDGVIEIFLWQTETGFSLHLVNYTNPNMTRGFIRRNYPVGPLRVSLGFPAARDITDIRALRSPMSLPFRREGVWVHFVLPKVEDYEVVALA
jgi:putative glycosyl hydrolase-like family 6 (GHL6) protein